MRLCEGNLLHELARKALRREKTDPSTIESCRMDVPKVPAALRHITSLAGTLVRPGGSSFMRTDTGERWKPLP
jgi:hypothetical protein